MTYVTESYVTDVSQAILDRIQERMGEGSTAYPTPTYLWVRTFGRTGGEGVQEFPESQQPVALVHYFHGRHESTEIGRAGKGTGKDYWAVYVAVRFTRDIVGYAGDDKQMFRKICEASATLLMARLIKELAGWPPSVRCAVTGKKSMYPRVEGWGANAVGMTDWSIHYQIQLAYTLPYEH